MKFSLSIPGLTLYANAEKDWVGRLTGSEILDVARRCDDFGFDHFRVSEHLAMHKDFVQGLGPRWTHALSAVGALAGATWRTRIVPLIVLPYHNAVELANALATLDFLSGGRVVLLAGAGYMEWEFELLGVPYAERGKIADEYLEAMIELWTKDEPEYHGTYVEFEDIVFEPKPVQAPHIPIWVAGYANPALRRLARFGEGWMTQNTTRVELASRLDYLYSQLAYSERPRPLEIGMPLFEGRHHPVTHEVIELARIVLERDAILDQVEQLAEVGVTIAKIDGILGGALGGGDATRDGKHVPPPRSVEEYLERLQWFAEEVMPVAATIAPAPRRDAA
jgi:probable F420-dependent oxidoreductase